MRREKRVRKTCMRMPGWFGVGGFRERKRRGDGAVARSLWRVQFDLNDAVRQMRARSPAIERTPMAIRVAVVGAGEIYLRRRMNLIGAFDGLAGAQPRRKGLHGGHCEVEPHLKRSAS